MQLLIAEDEKNIRHIIRTELSDQGFEVDEAENGLRALEMLERKEYDVLLLDLNMPVMGGMEVLTQINAREIPTEVIVLTANTALSAAIQAMKLGAYDFLAKPFHLEELTPVIEKAYEKKRLRRENQLLKVQVRRQTDQQVVIADSPVMRDLFDTVRRVATTDVPVLVIGESGTGKEVIASALHRESKRSAGPFIAINCAAIPETMIESELFGYEKGAFTGALTKKLGLLEAANTGTLFLDEIGDMPMPLQVKLLRVIESGRFFRLGSTSEQRTDIRIVAATNKNLEMAIADGQFRADLFYRIASFVLRIPPLRERLDDIPALVEHFKRKHPEFRSKTFSPAALQALASYPWPGNIRELQNVVSRTLVMARGASIGIEDIPCSPVHQTPRKFTRLEDVEREHILKILKESDGHRGNAAKLLGIDPKTLYRKLDGYAASTLSTDDGVKFVRSKGRDA